MTKIVLFLIVIFLISLVSGATLNLGDSYQKKETAIGEIVGNVIEQISPEQVKLTRNGVEVAFEYGIKNLGGRNFVWLVTPANEANYTLTVENVVSNVGGSVETQDLEKNFFVGNQTSNYFLKPGAIFAAGNFEVTVVLNNDAPETISVDFPESREIILQSGENKIQFDIESVGESGIVNLMIGKYSVPAYIVGRGGSPGNNSGNFGNNESQNNTNESQNEIGNENHDKRRKFC